jgi:hypothetical protein
MVGVKMSAYPLDGPFPALDFEHIGPTGIGKAIVAKALEQGLEISAGRGEAVVTGIALHGLGVGEAARTALR